MHRNYSWRRLLRSVTFRSRETSGILIVNKMTKSQEQSQNAGFRIPRMAGPLLQKSDVYQITLLYQDAARAEIAHRSQDKCLETDHNWTQKCKPQGLKQMTTYYLVAWFCPGERGTGRVSHGLFLARVLKSIEKVHVHENTTQLSTNLKTRQYLSDWGYRCCQLFKGVVHPKRRIPPNAHLRHPWSSM